MNKIAFDQLELLSTEKPVVQYQGAVYIALRDSKYVSSRDIPTSSFETEIPEYMWPQRARVVTMVPA